MENLLAQKSTCFNSALNGDQKMNIEKQSFGHLGNGIEIYLFTIKNNCGAELKITNYGAVFPVKRKWTTKLMVADL